MIRNFLALLGLVFITLLAILGAGLSLSFLDLSGAIDIEGQPYVADLRAAIDRLDIRSLTSDLVGYISGLGSSSEEPVIAVEEPETVSQEALPNPGSEGVDALVNGGGILERKNLVDGQPIPPTPEPAPTFTPTPVPPLDPVVYRTEVLLRSKNFGAALEAFMDANEKLGQNDSLMQDAAWRSEMATLLEGVRAAGLALAEVGPPPAEYQVIDALLDRVSLEAASLRENYLRGMETGEARHFNEASDNFARIKDTMFQAVGEMAKAGWPLD